MIKLAASAARAGLSLALPLAAAAALAAGVASASTRRAANGLAYSTASPAKVQLQPAAGSCHARGSGLYELPDPRCTPGSLNPAVTQSTIYATICKSGWTSTVRPPESVTEPEKIANMAAYGDRARTSEFEYDHQVPLELGGAVNDPHNLWPEPDYSTRAGFYLNPKDHLERALNRQVCSGGMTLSQAQHLIAVNWVSAFHTFG
jgi:hypothetical protein